jgi:hypothetical protein
MKSPPKEKPAATLATATGRDDYGAAYKFLRCVQRPFFAVGWRIEKQCARIETKRELDNWNREQR